MSAASEAVAFLTPFGRSRGRPSPQAMTYFPVVGALLGAGEGVVWRWARRTWPALPAAVVALGADVAMTGALHLDGLADTADGLLAHAPRKDRLDIMSAPDLGTFGTVALSVALMGRAAALSDLEPSPALLAALACGSRSAMVVAARKMTYVREHGLASAFLPATGSGDGALRAGITGMAAATVVAGVAEGRRGVIAMVAAAAAASGVLLAAQRRLGGYTGDVLGAAGSVFETVGLLASARR